MSILNAWISPTRAVVAVDTLGALMPSGRHVHLSKLFPICHANVVLAARGSSDFLAEVVRQQPLFGDNFDSVVRAMPDAISQAMAFLKAVYESKGLSVDSLLGDGNQELLLVGWSDSASRILCVRWQRAGRDEFVAQDVDDQIIAPGGLPEHLLEPDLDSPERMHRIAVEQLRMVRSRFPAVTAIGGRLVVAELTRNAISMSSCGTPLGPQHAEVLA